jgi:tetratricopeptide (TPR) repeat protein
MSKPRFFTAAVLLPLLCAASCSSGGTEYDPNTAAGVHSQSKADVMVGQAERSLRIGDLKAAERQIAGIAKDLGANLAQNPAAQKIMARTLIASGRFQECETLLDAVQEINPEDPEVYMIRGTLEEARGRWQSARVAYATAAEKNPELSSPVLFMANTYMAVGEPESAAAMLEREYAMRPGRFDLQQALGDAYLAAGEPKMAAAWLKKALDHDQSNRKIRSQLAFAQSLAGQHLEALQTVQTVGDQALQPHVKLTLGRSALVVNESHLAVRWLDQYLGHFADDAGAWLDLARAHFLLDRPAKTMDALTACLRLDPGRADALVLLGHLRVRAGQDALAVNSYLEAIRLGAEASALAPLMEELVNAGAIEEGEE